jgi:hypothetical protein
VSGLGENTRLRGALLRLAVALVSVLFLAGPVPGDVGGCGQSAKSLDAAGFFLTKRALDCTRCEECGLESRTCDDACSAEPAKASLPRGCDPLEHDGDVCLRALVDASCDEYAAFVRDQAPEAPSECNFCPRGAP